MIIILAGAAGIMHLRLNSLRVLIAPKAAGTVVSRLAETSNRCSFGSSPREDGRADKQLVPAASLTRVVHEPMLSGRYSKALWSTISCCSAGMRTMASGSVVSWLLETSSSLHKG